MAKNDWCWHIIITLVYYYFFLDHHRFTGHARYSKTNSLSSLFISCDTVVGMCGHGSATLLERKTHHTARTPPTPSRQDIYEAAEDLWAKALALNTLAPEFQFQNNTEVAAQVGGEATFSCYTYHLSDEMVSSYMYN